MTSPARADGATSSGTPAGTAPLGATPMAPGAPDPLTLVPAAGLVVLAVLVAAGFDRVFAGGPVLRIGVGAAVGAAVVGEGLGRVARRSASTTLLGSLVAALVVAPFVVLRTGPTAGAVRQVVADLADAPRRILSLPLPVSPGPELLVVVFATTWVVCAASLELARRRRDPFSPLLPVVAGLAVPVLLAAEGPTPTAGRWALVLVLAGSVALARSADRDRGTIRSGRSRRAGQRRRVLVGLPLVAVVALLAPGLADVAPGVGDRPRLDARRTPTTDPVRLDSPLARVAAIRRDPQRVTAFTATGATGVSRWRLAVLDRYDGTSWTASGDLVPVADELPDDAEPGREVTFDVEVGTTGTVFLPVPGDPTALSGPDVRLDRTTRNVAIDAETSDGARYRVTARVAEVTEAERAQGRATREGADALVAGASVPGIERLQAQARLQADAAAAVPGRSVDIAQLEALQRFLADPTRFAISREPASGETLRQLEDLVVGPFDDGEQRTGSPEQFVAAYAVLARSLGFASRVVVGYAPSVDGRSTTARSDDIETWAEVKLADLGWVRFEAGPDTEQDAPDLEEDTEEPPPASSGAQPDPEEPPTRPDRSGRSAPAGGPPWPAIGGVVLALALLGALARRPLRRWRRSRGDGRERVLGAWAEAVDLLGRAGAPTGRARSNGEVVAGAVAGAVVAEPGRGPLAALATLADRVTWSRAEAVPAADGDAAWAELGALRPHVDRSAARRAVGGRAGRRSVGRRPADEGVGE